MSTRKASVLARNLPAGAQVWRECDFENAWTDEAWVGAFIADVGQVANWQRGGGEGPRPKPLPRPGDERRAKVQQERIASKAAAFQARQRDRAIEPPTRPRDARGRFVKEA